MGFKHFGSPGVSGARIESDMPLRLVNGAPFLPRSPSISDHFTYGAGALNSHVPQNWVTTETGAATPFAPGAAALGGLLVATTGATTNNAEEMAGKNVGWKPSTMAPLVLEVRLKAVGATTATDGDFYIGFADAVTYTSGLAYVFSAASAFTTSAPVEFAGFGYSSIPTSGALFNSGANFIGVVTEKSSVAALAATTIAKDSNFHIYRVEMDASANAAFFIDDIQVGAVAAATTAATALVPYLSGIAKNSHANTITVDFINVGGSYV
jgi:hypothetical protein